MALLVVLLIVSVATVLALSFTNAQSTTRGIAANIEDHAQAQFVADSGLRMAVRYVQSDGAWRDDQSDGVWIADAAVAGGTVEITGEDGFDNDGDGIVDGDGNLADDPQDLLTLTVTGRASQATAIARAVITPGVTNGLKVLFVVPDPDNLTASDEAHISLFEGWDYSVTTIAANAGQAAFDSAAAGANVAYITEAINAGQLDTKLRNAAIGVVCEHRQMQNEFGFSIIDGFTYTNSQIDITDAGHEITGSFGTGLLTIMDSPQLLVRSSFFLASGVEVLAEVPWSFYGTLTVVDKGNTVFPGDTAAARRVMLPWGGNSAAFFALNDNGKALMKNAIEWSAEESSGNTGALAHWPFDDGSGTTAGDVSGNGYDGTLTNMSPSTAWISGTLDGAIQLDGSNDYVALNSFTNLTGSFTITAWIRPASTAGDQRIFCDDRNNSGGFAFSLGDPGSGRLRFFSRGISPVSLDSGVVVSAGSWQFVAIVHDADARKRYIYHGESLAAQESGPYSGTWGSDSGPAAIGGEVDGAGEGVAKYRFGGAIDDVRVYDEALSAEEISAVYNNETTGETTFSVRWVK